MPSAKNPEKRNKAIELRKQGKSVEEIAKILGLAVSTIRGYTAGYKPANPNLRIKNHSFGWELMKEWTDTVNVFRRYVGKKPFPIPYPQDTRPDER